MLVDLDATSTGYADTTHKGEVWLVRYGSSPGERRNIARVRSRGVPRILYSSNNSLLIGRCCSENGDYIYGICAQGQLRCLRLATGERVWESQAVTVEQRRNASAFMVRHQDRYFINNDRGELIIARLSPKGYQEISRTELIKPTTEGGGRRERGAVNWSHPAYADRHIFARNDEEIICADLGKYR